MTCSSFRELVVAAEAEGSLGRAAIRMEADETGVSRTDVVSRLEDTLLVMRESISEGLGSERRSRSGLTGGDARLVSRQGGGISGPVLREALAGALAVAEVNAAMGRVVAAPTGGASGVVPGVLFAVAASVEASPSALAEALACAGAIGGVIAARATLSGAAAGCQAEIGSASAMAAAAACELAGGSAEQCGHAASLALQGQMGLVCDPVGGLVEIPCVARNATGAAVALAAAELATAGVEFPIPFDEVADAMAAVGGSLPGSLRETALGGLAMTPTALDLVERTRG
jgi:L-serine dehydratase